MKRKLLLAAVQNTTIDLNELIKYTITQEQLAKLIDLSRSQVQVILQDPERLSTKRLSNILLAIGYELHLNIVKV